MPVVCSYGKHKSFLEMVPQGHRVRVQPTELGKSCLNRFWSLWLRELILTKTDHRHGFTVELYGGNVVIASNTTSAGLYATVGQLAGEVRPLLVLPLKRWFNRNDPGPKSYGPIIWGIDRPNLPVKTIIDGMTLPRGADLRFEEPWGEESRFEVPDLSRYELLRNGRLKLTYGGGPLAGRELAMLVELKFALACNT